MNWKVIVYICILFLVFLDPYFFNIPFGPIRLTMLRAVIFLSFLYLVGNFFLGKRKSINETLRYPVFFIFIWFIYGTISFFWAADKNIAIKQLYYFAVFIMLILVLVHFLNTRNQDLLINFSLRTIGFITISISVIELITKYHLPTSRYVIEYERFLDNTSRVATSFFYNENDLSLFLVMIAPFFLIKTLDSNLFPKIFNFTILITIIIIVYFNDARLAFISLCLQFLFFLFNVNRSLCMKFFRFSLLISPLILIGWLIFFQERVEAFIDVQGLQEGYGSSFVRLNLYINGLFTLFHTFMLGVGPGNFQNSTYPFFDTNGIVDPHNWWIEILTNYGLLIFVGYLFFFGFILKKLFIFYKEDPKKNTLSLVLMLSFIGFIPGSLAPSSLFYFWPMWLFYGIALAYIHHKSKVNT